ncbi:MAG: hypothetical protein V3S51_02055 [Dehalococcoidia bacterium]
MEHIDPLAKVNLENMELITEIHDLKKQITALQATNEKLVEEKRELEQKLADSDLAFEEANKIIGKLEQDGKRLDWLESFWLINGYDNDGEKTFNHRLMATDTLGQAIDKAMAKGGE